jgi:hypothetical protein
MLKLLEFDFVIEYKKGSENSVADALSRKHTEAEMDSCQAISTVVPTWLTEVIASYEQDKKCMQLLQELTLKEDYHPNYRFTSGIIRYKNRIVIGENTDLKEKIFQTFHSSALGGHSGNRVTHHRIKQVFFWPHMKQFIADKVAHCPVCQISKTERVHYPGFLDPLNIPKMKWSEISMDFIEGLTH